MKGNEFTQIIEKLIRENKELKDRINIVEEILHSYLPIIERKEDESS